jgi:hypothetical protein
MASAVSIKVPKFVEESPSTWFIILEAQFQNVGITVSKTQFYHALSKLPVSTVQRIPRSIITGEDYDDLKNNVVSNYEATKPELFESLMSKAIYTGRPSAYLSEIRQIADKIGVGDDLVRHKFTQSLPPNVRPVIATQKKLPLDALGTLADELLPMFESNANISSVGENSSYRANSHNFQNAGNSSSYANNTRNFQNAGNRYNRPNTKEPERTAGRQHMGLKPFNENQRQKICRAHIFFGEKARTCRTWCVWPNKEGVTVTPPSGNASRESSPNRLNRTAN